MSSMSTVLDRCLIAALLVDAAALASFGGYLIFMLIKEVLNERDG